MKTIAFNLLLLIAVLVIFSNADAKGIRFKAPKVSKPRIPSVSVPKPNIPVIVPVPIILPVGGFGSGHYFSRNHYINKNSKLQCYSCEGSDNDLCAISPATGSRKVTCAEKNMFCSVVRKETPIDDVAIVYNVTSPTTNQTDIVTIDSQNSTATPSSNPEALTENTPTTTEGIVSSSTVDSMTTDTSVANVTIDDGADAMTLSRSTRDATMRVVIQRGCKSLDFIEGVSLASTTRKNGNESEYVNAQLCTTDLCNSGDGRLRCYECTGTGQNNSCMVKPSTVAKVLICQQREACYVERKTVTLNSTSTNSTETEVTVSRGCRAASRSDDQNVISRKDGKLEMSCRLSDFCNSFDANRLVRSNSAAGNHATILSVVFMFTVLHLLIQK